MTVLKSDWITQGPRTEAFEQDLARYTGASHVSVLANGTLALQAAVHAIGIQPGDEVIVPAITFVATGNCVFHNGGKPVIADVDPITGLININDLQSRITSRTRAIIPVHLAGVSCDMMRIHAIACEYNLRVIEDACHALGGNYQGGKICGCSYSDMAVTSFHPVKSITTGEGGAAFTNDIDLNDRVQCFRNHGITKVANRLVRHDGPWYYEMQELGTNARMTDFQCALGQMQLKRIGEFITRRRTIAHYYNESLADVPEILLPNDGNESAWHLYIIHIDTSMVGEDRLQTFMRLRQEGLGVNVHYIPLHFHPYYQNRLGVRPGDFPGAEKYYRNSLSLPIFPAMSNQDVERTVETVRSVVLKLHQGKSRLGYARLTQPTSVKRVG